MKKTAILFLTISLFASCGKEMSPEEAVPGRITLECALPVTRAYLDGTSFVWNANDVITRTLSGIHMSVIRSQL